MSGKIEICFNIPRSIHSWLSWWKSSWSRVTVISGMLVVGDTEIAFTHVLPAAAGAAATIR